MKRLHVLLPQRERAGIDTDTVQQLARADRLENGKPGHLAMLGEFFSWPGKELPAAALTRQQAAGDAAQHTWLCADPAWVEVDINGARLMACGTLDLSRDEAEQLAATLRPLLGDFGALLELTTANRWHLRLPAGARLPGFDGPDTVLGADLLPHLEGDGERRRWRHLFNEVQTELHQHPVKVQREKHGRTPCNALWFWGGGALPAWMKTQMSQVFSDDRLVLGLASQAKAAGHSLQDFDNAAKSLDSEVLLDLGQHAIGTEAWHELLALLRQHRVDELHLLFASGERYRLKRSHRWRFWRRAS